MPSGTITIPPTLGVRYRHSTANVIRNITPKQLSAAIHDTDKRERERDEVEAPALNTTRRYKHVTSSGYGTPTYQPETIMSPSSVRVQVAKRRTQAQGALSTEAKLESERRALVLDEASLTQAEALVAESDEMSQAVAEVALGIRDQ
ncbi:hypothetical protein KIPB_012413, partial [Kipferlia bialata]|eukprot:g12413.t1